MESTITEHDLDPGSAQLAQMLSDDEPGVDSDLAVDGLSESLMSRLYSFLMHRGK